MINNSELVRLVKRAQLGDKESLRRLAEAARVRLHEHVFRLTLQEDLTQDIVQETILEMFRVFKKLRKAERFWSWLHGIAFNRVRRHYGRQWRHKTTSLSEMNRDIPARDSQNALAGMINRELKQVVIRSMQELAPRHRAVLTMRCYEQMPYSKIADLMGCTEFGAQSLFYRAKKSLAKKLSHHGLGKQYLLAALVVFGRMTATTEATAANVSITAATLKVGAAASVAAAVTSKTAVVSLAAAGVIAAGTATTALRTGETGSGPLNSGTENSLDSSQQKAAGRAAEQCWYFFPEGPGKPVMTRLVMPRASGKGTYCQLLQNQHANYHYGRNSISVNNYRMYNADFSVRRLPTDGADLTRFISQVEGKQADMEYIPGRGKGLLVISSRSADKSNRTWKIDRHFNVLEEEYFQFDWPASAAVIDNRDAMHQRGWTYFRISGRLNGKPVSGAGRMPFVYAASKQFGPWLELTLDGGTKIVDDGTRACVLDAAGNTVVSCEGGSFFKGLGRPWMGLHTIDTVRRDAAEQHVWYETKYLPGSGKAELVLTSEHVRFIYLIDMESDFVERITVSRKGGGRAELRFSYLQNIESLGEEFTRPSARSDWQAQQDPVGILWLATLAEKRW